MCVVEEGGCIIITKSVLVTGGSGVIGRDVIRKLSMERIPYCALSGREIIRNPSVIKSMGRKIGSILHLAAAVPGQGKNEDDFDSAQQTRLLDKIVLEAATQWGPELCTRLV